MLDKLISIDESVAQRIDMLDLKFSRYGVDPYGVDKAELGRAFTVFRKLYRDYFDVQVFGLEHVPGLGRALLVGNHSGGVPIDATIVIGSLFFDKNPPRLPHAMVERFVHRIPGAAQFFSRTGQFTGNPEQAERLLRDERLVLVFPEGARGTAKLAKDADRLVKFGTGFVRLALQTRTPIVPFGLVGGGEALPTVANLKRLGKMLGVPYIPVPKYLLMLPRRTSFQLLYGEPIELEGTGEERESEVEALVEQVRERIARLIQQGRRLRNGSISAEELDLS